MKRDVAVVLSGGGINGLLLELGFLERLRESELWPRVGWFFGSSAGALNGWALQLAPIPLVSVSLNKLLKRPLKRLLSPGPKISARRPLTESSLALSVLSFSMSWRRRS